jgi:hypothetical protein
VLARVALLPCGVVLVLQVPAHAPRCFPAPTNHTTRASKTTPNTPHRWANNAGKRWRGNRAPTASVNFVSAHDGFTLADLVAFNDKHNEVGAVLAV